MNRKSLKLEGIYVQYYDAGAGPPALFVHGAGATGRLWHRQLGPLSGGFRVMAPDLPGFGGSDNSPAVRKVRDYAGFLAGFLKALGIDRASVVGHSMGGWAACWFARDFSEKVDKLVLISPAGLYFPDNPPMPVSRVLKEIENFYSNFSISGEKVKLKINPADEMKKGAETIMALDRAGGFAPDVSGALAGINAKTLIIWGSEDRVIPVSYARAFNKEIRGSGLRVISGAGHMPFLERPDEVNGLLSAFLKEKQSA